MNSQRSEPRSFKALTKETSEQALKVLSQRLMTQAVFAECERQAQNAEPGKKQIWFDLEMVLAERFVLLDQLLEAMLNLREFTLSVDHVKNDEGER